MRRLSPFLAPLTPAAAAGLLAYAGYGAGLARAAGAGLPHWLQVAAVAASGVGLLAFGLWRGRDPAPAPAGSFAEDLAALERLIPVVRDHPDGIPSLQDLIDVLFEARHRPAAARKPAVLAEKESRSHA